jgi:two-component system, response regulator
MVTIPDGQEAVDYLFREPQDANGHPGALLLILLGLSLPSLDGFQVLERMRTDERTKHIPVIILTAMDIPDHIEQCYAWGCSTYITKPIVYSWLIAPMEFTR